MGGNLDLKNMDNLKELLEAGKSIEAVEAFKNYNIKMITAFLESLSAEQSESLFNQVNVKLSFKSFILNLVKTNTIDLPFVQSVLKQFGFETSYFEYFIESVNAVDTLHTFIEAGVEIDSPIVFDFIDANIDSIESPEKMAVLKAILTTGVDTTRLATGIVTSPLIFAKENNLQQVVSLLQTHEAALKNDKPYAFKMLKSKFQELVAKNQFSQAMKLICAHSVPNVLFIINSLEKSQRKIFLSEYNRPLNIYIQTQI